jgi:hypothetical protein
MGRAWARGEITWTQARTAAFAANARSQRSNRRCAGSGARRRSGRRGGARDGPRAAAAYAIKAARAASSEGEGDDAGRRECTWQRDQLPDEIRELVLDDQRLRNKLCWFAFDC